MNFEVGDLFQKGIANDSYQLYIARESGEWLVHPDQSHEYAVQKEQPFSLASDFPELNNPFENDLLNEPSEIYFERWNSRVIEFESQAWRVKPENQKIAILLKNDAGWLQTEFISSFLTGNLPLGLALILAYFLGTRLVRSMDRSRTLLLTLKEEQISLRQKNDDIQQAFDDLNALQNQLVETRKIASLGMMVAGISHELNTPISGTKLALEYLNEHIPRLKNKFLSGELTEDEFFSILDSAANSLQLADDNLSSSLNLIQRFKMLAKNASSEEAYEFNLLDEIHSFQSSFERHHGHRNIELHVDCASDIVLHTHGFVLRQALSNIAENAVQHAFEENQKGDIYVQVEHQGENIVLTIKDNGRGISENHVRQIFDPFFTTGRSRGRTGLGLHIVHLWVSRILKGTIHVFSIPEQGTTFTIELPAVVSEEDSRPASAHTQQVN